MSGIEIPSKYIYDPLFASGIDTDPAQQAGASNVKTYYLSKEDLEARYGHLKKPQKNKKRRRPRDQKITKEMLIEILQKRTVKQAAFGWGISADSVYKLVELFGLELDEKGRLKWIPEELEVNPEVEKDEQKGAEKEMAVAENIEIFDHKDAKKSKIEIAREIITQKRLEAELAKGKTTKQIAKENAVHPWIVSKLKKEYCLVAQEEPEQNDKLETKKIEPKAKDYDFIPSQNIEGSCCSGKLCFALNEMGNELDQLLEKIQQLEETINTLSTFTYKHRHCIAAGHFSDRGVD